MPRSNMAMAILKQGQEPAGSGVPGFIWTFQCGSNRNLLIGVVLAEGSTSIENAASEPEIVDPA